MSSYSLSRKDKFGALTANLQSSSSQIADQKAAYRLQQQELQYRVNERRASLKASIEAGVDPQDLEDMATSHKQHHLRGVGSERQLRSAGAAVGDFGGMKSFGKRMMGIGGSGGGGSGGANSSSSSGGGGGGSRGPPGGGFKSGSRF